MRDDTPWPPKPDVAPDGEKLTVPAADVYVDVAGPANELEMVTAQLRAAGFNVSGQQNRKAATKTKVMYPPSQVAEARTLAFATGATMQAKSDAYQVKLVIGENFDGVRKNMTLKKGQSKGSSDSLDPRNAAQQICAN